MRGWPGGAVCTRRATRGKPLTTRAEGVLGGRMTPLSATAVASRRPDADSAPSHGDASADDLALRHLALAESVARRYFRQDAARDEDLLQVAYLGLVNAAHRFDPDRGGSFAAFAVPTIDGEIKRHLRDHGWFIRPPRALQELQARVRDVTPVLAQRSGRAPSPAEVAAELGVSAAEVEEALACLQNLSAASLDVHVGADRDDTLADLVPDAHDEEALVEAAAMVWAASRDLTPRERLVVHLRWFEDRTQQEIADEIGVTQMQVSRILSKTLGRLREGLGVQEHSRA